MPKLPVLSGEEFVRALQKAGFAVVRQKGSHVSLRKENFKTVVLSMTNSPKAPSLASSSNAGCQKKTLKPF